MRRLSATLLFISMAFPTLMAAPAVAPPPAGAILVLRHAAALGQAEAQKPTPARLEGLDAFITQAMKDWKVPGLSLAIVQDGKVIFSKGYGYRDVQKQLPVTPKTLFAIGSITKSFTVTTLGMLVDDGKLDWDKPVRRYLPDFQLNDAVASERITPRDLVTHRTGLPRHDMVWYSSNFSRPELIERLRYLELSKDLRQTFQYNNLMFMTAGMLAGQRSGTTWEEAVRQRVLTPLGMTGTNFSVLDSQKSDDFARPYEKDHDENVKEVPFHFQVAIGPAGEINTGVVDLARYLLFHLNKGKLEGKQLLSESNAVQMQTPQMVTQRAPQFKEEGEGSYGMGFFISTYRGHKQVEHGGGIDGFTAELAFLPNDGIGVVVLNNLGGSPLPGIVTYNVFDRLLGLDQIPWNQRYLDIDKKAKESEKEAKSKGYTAPKPSTHPSHDMKDYAGEYENPGYGVVMIAQDGNDLKFTLNRLTSPLKHFHYDVFQIPENALDPLEKTKVMFYTDVKGDISSLSVPLEPNVKEIVFTRRPEAAMTERSFLEPLTGQYELPGVTITVSLKGEHTLVTSVPGQPERELVPVRGTTFDLRDLTGFSIEFKKDASGKVAEAILYQPNGTFVARRK